MKWRPFTLAALAAIAFTGCGKQDPAAKPSAVATPALPGQTSEPMTSRVTGTGTLFSKVPAAESGIDFVHRWEPRTEHEQQLLKTGFAGGGVALADYDGDGRCDVFLTRPHGGGRLYRNLGAFRFADVTAQCGIGEWEALVTGAAWADLDNDGDLDLTVLGYRAESAIFLNDAGAFVRAPQSVRLAHVGANVKVAFADYDLDGDLDAYLVTNRGEPDAPVEPRYEGTPGNYRVPREFDELVGVIQLPDRQQFVKAGQYDHLYRNELKETGALAFTDVSAAAGIRGNHHGLDVIWWDADGDGRPDIYVANDFTDPDQFWHNNGDGTFTDVTLASLPHTPWFSMGAVTADFDADGLFDLLVTDMSATSHYREKMSMGAMDAVAWFLDTAEPRQYMRNALFVNSGTPRFMEAAHMSGLASSDWTWSVKAGDYDNDGREDVFVTNGFTRDYNDADFAEKLKAKGITGADAWMQAPELREKNLAFRNEGGLKFTNVSAAWGVDEQAISFGAAQGDLDGDGDLDLVVNNFGEAVSVLRNGGTDGHGLTLQLRGQASNRRGIGARVEVRTAGGSQRRYFNPGGGFMSADEPALHFGLGNDTVAEEVVIHWPSGAVQRLAKLAADRRYVIAEGGAAAERVKPEPAMFAASPLLAAAVHREANYDDFARQPLLPNRVSRLGPSLAMADVDGDGLSDLFLGGAAGQAGQLFRRTALGFAAMATTAFDAAAECEDMGCAFFDADGDGDQDLFVASGGVENDEGSPFQRDHLYIYGGGGNWTKGELPDHRDSGGPVAVADFDKDGDQDVFVGGRVVPGAWPRPGASRFLRNEGRGKFAEVPMPEFERPGMVTDALAKDVDGDGLPDLLLAIEYGPLKLLRNTGGWKFADATADAGLAKLSGWWMSLAAADVDGDGDVDFAAGNQGLNTKYHPTEEKPQLCFYGDFDGSGGAQIVEAKTSAAGLLPVRGRSCSSQAMPFLRSKFSTFHAFASASLEEIYPPGKLSASLRLEATVTASGLLLNDGKGRFEFHELPRMAQISPARAMVFFHADGDGKLDLFMAQNFFSPQRETGRMDGGLGLLMPGDGKGGFTPVRPDRSGIVVARDMADVIAADMNGDQRPDLIIATNDGPLFVFTARPAGK